ncbi:MAG: HD-GYP domain-containing protein [Burkholderiales bacterium]|nr:HD-GYP domain-containing protein [Burkholderiales bacterium]
MLKKISVHQLRPGMYLHGLCGSWLDHPFWKTSFVIKGDEEIRKLLDSPVREVWIDAAKGLDVAEFIDTAPAPLAEPEPASAQPAEPQVERISLQLAPEPPQPVALTDEVARAARLCRQAEGAVKDMFQDIRLGKAVDAEHCLPLVDEITSSVQRNPGAIVSLARLKTKDDYTYMHSVAVCALMVALSRQLKLPEAETREAGLAGLLHDLGKAAMPLEVLNKPGKLTPEEYAIMRTHPAAGHAALVEGRGVGPIPLDVCLHHHERIDGKGYPHGLTGAQMTLHAKMGAVCDVYDAITSNRPYKAGWDPAESIQRMAQWAREGHFDEGVFQAFVKSIGIYPTGSLVKLESGRLGVVVEQNASSLLEPLVRVFWSTKSNEPIPRQFIDLSVAGVKDRIVSREKPTDWGFKNLDELWGGEEAKARLGG